MAEIHGGSLVSRVLEEPRATDVRDAVVDAPTIDLDWVHFQDTINIAVGRYSPLSGFMTREEYLSVVFDLSLSNSTVWPLPITLDVERETATELSVGERAKLRSPTGGIVGVIDVEDVYEPDLERVVEPVFGTTDENHPGVSEMLRREPCFVGGSIHVFDDYRYNGYDLRPEETRESFRRLGWETIVGFQTRNAPHRAHEYIQKHTLKRNDGLLIHPKLGRKKKGDYSDDAIVGAYDVLTNKYFQADSVVLSVFPNIMRYAGPREAVFDALVRKNHGCTSFVVGRDHAGVGDYYDEFAAQQIFDELGDLGIDIEFYDHVFYCGNCDGMVTETRCSHGDESRTYPSGSNVRESIRNGSRPSEEIMRPEVSDFLVRVEQPFVGTQSAAVGFQ